MTFQNLTQASINKKKECPKSTRIKWQLRKKLLCNKNFRIMVLLTINKIKAILTCMIIVIK